MLVPILRAPAESFAADSTDDSGADGIVDATEKGGEGLWAGSQMGLVTGFQTNANSRVVFAGGIDLFSDEYARKELPSGTPSGNSQLARDIAAWVFQETLTLRIDSVEHHRVNQTEAPEMYTTNDQIVSYYDAVVLLNDSLRSGVYSAYLFIRQQDLDMEALQRRQ
jgi:oligosaccharyltransferase complex subunit beta